MLSWYSFCLIILSIIDISQKYDVKNSGMVSAAASVAIFALSLFTYGERYSERANEFRACYLKLQHLYDAPVSAEDKMAQYADILDQYENQSGGDYDEMLFDAWWRGQRLTGANGAVSISKWGFCKVLFVRFVKAVGLAAFLMAPIIVGAAWIHPAK
jgi:hypothetical protein